MGYRPGTGWRKKFDDIFSYLHTIHEREGQTDKRRHFYERINDDDDERRTLADSKDPAYAYRTETKPNRNARFTTHGL